MTAERSTLAHGIPEQAAGYALFTAPTELRCGEMRLVSLVQVRQSPGPRATLSGQLVIGTDWEQCRLIVDLVARGAESRGFDEKTVDAIRIALEEAIANAVRHGNRSGDGCIRVDYSFREDSFRVRVTDQGSGFDPNLVPDPTLPENIHKPTGRGLLLMRHYMTEVRFNDRGNSVEMWKRCRRESGSWSKHGA